MRAPRKVHVLQKAEPHFRPERDPIGVHPRRVPRTADEQDTCATTVRRQMIPGKPPRASSAPRLPHAFRGLWFTWLSGAVVVVVAFGIALWLTSPVEAPPGVTILANATVSDTTGLMAAVQTAGLRGTSDVKGAIEGLKRIDDQRVMITGWAVDKTASSSSLTIIAFAAGRHAMTAVTSGPRKDIAQMFGLSDASTRYVSFEATLACSPSQNLIVVAVTADRTYSQFRSLICP